MSKKTEPRYLIMDSRGFAEPENAAVYTLAYNTEEAIEKSKLYGNYLEFEVCIYDSKSDRVCWELYEKSN